MFKYQFWEKGLACTYRAYAHQVISRSKRNCYIRLITKSCLADLLLLLE